MSKIKLNLFELFSLGWISFAILSLALAVMGIFTPIFLITIGVVLLGGLIWKIKKRIIIVTRPLMPLPYGYIACLFLLGATLSLLSTPTIFGGRDEGAYSNAAILLSQTHGLTASSPLIEEFKKIYGPGKALNFPGFYYTHNDSVSEIKSQFLPGYISWLAIWYSFAGLMGITFANILPFITYLLSFYLVIGQTIRLISPQAQKTLPARWNKLGMILLATSFPLLVFYKFTLSEIFFGSLAWFALYLLLKYFEQKNLSNFVIIFLPLILMAFTRIETVAFIFTLLIIFILKDYKRLSDARYQFMFAFITAIFMLAVLLNSNFFIDQLKNLFEPLIKGNDNRTNLEAISNDLKNLYLIKVFFTYNILPTLVLGTVYIGYLFKKGTHRALIPFVFFAPTLIYLVDANITLDHPWMLRRFLFSILPLFTLYTVLLLWNFNEKIQRLRFLSFFPYLLIGCLITANLSLFFSPSSLKDNFLVFRQNKTLLIQVKQLSQKFFPSDLVLISQKSSGNGWSLIAEPMRNIYGIPAVYFFNPSDLEKIDKSRFSNIYLISAEEEQLFSKINKNKIADYSLENSLIAPSRDPFANPSILLLHSKGSIYKIEK